jgi:hypothetical protein
MPAYAQTSRSAQGARLATLPASVYLGYAPGSPRPATSRHKTDGEFNWSQLQRLDDGFFVKLAYQIRP